MAINRRYRDGFLTQLDASQRGEVVFIPNPLDRVGDIFNIMPSRYTLLFGATGSGKTSFLDYEYILGPWSFLQQKSMDIHWEVQYFSLERKETFKHAKWLSWLMYRDNSELLVSADQILGWKNGPLNSAGYNLVREYDDEMSGLLEHVRIYDGKPTAVSIERTIQRRAIALGTFFYADHIGVRKNDELIYIETFEEKGLFEDTKIGKIPYIELEFKGEKFRLEQETHKYFLNHPRTFVFFVLDGINLLGDKNLLDDISILLARARDRYGFSPVIVSQQNRALGDIQRAKLHGSDLAPQLEDVFKTSQMAFDADLILGLFDPYKYKAWDSDGKYGGYCVNPLGNITKPSTLTPKGVNRFRSIHVLKNSFGNEGNIYGTKFLGECNHFETLPLPGSIELEEVYSNIKRGL